MPDAEPVTLSLSDRLETSRQALMDAIAGLDEEGFRARPASGDWTAAEVMSHLLHDEPELLEYARAALEEDDVAVAPTTSSERETQAREVARRMPVPQIIHGLLACRRDTLALLDRLTPAQLGRPVRHSGYGDVSVARLFQHIAEHEEQHAVHVRAIRARTGRNPQNASAL